VEYDIIVCAGFGGGTLAAHLFDRNKILKKKILIIESGNFIFASHCLNTAGPTVVGDSAQQTEASFKLFRDVYKTSASPHWDGGPLHALGGRGQRLGTLHPATA
jgi:hypothetical protein